MTRLFKLVETGADGEKTGRVAYVLEPESLPEPATGFGWQEDMSFRPGEAILADGGLEQVFGPRLETALRLSDNDEHIPPRRQARYSPPPAVFLLQIGTRPVLALEAISNREAQELAKEQWLLDA